MKKLSLYHILCPCVLLLVSCSILLAQENEEKSETPPPVTSLHEDVTKSTQAVDEEDELLRLFLQQRKQYGDIAVQANLQQVGQEPKPEETPSAEEAKPEEETKPVEEVKSEVEPNANQGIYIGIIFLVSALLALGGILLGYRKTEVDTRPEIPKTQQIGGAPDGKNDKPVIDVPVKFPSDWFKGIDSAEIARLVKSAKASATDAFFENLGTQDTPTLADIEVANKSMGDLLKERTQSLAWIDVICGEKMGYEKDTEKEFEQRNSLKLHLKTLLVPPEISDPTLVHTEVRTSVLCAVTAVGAVLGFLCGGWVAHWILGIPAESGLLFGAPIGAALGVAFVMSVAGNETLRNRILLVLGIAGGIDIAFQIGKGFLPWPTGGKVSFAKRLALYAVLALVTFVSRRERICDKAHYRKEVESTVENWLRSVLVVIVVLAFKIESTGGNDDDSILKKAIIEIVAITKKLLRVPQEDVPLVTKELVQELEKLDFTFPPPPPVEEPMVWNESLKNQYEMMGIIRDNDPIKVVEEPIIRNGVVEKKGLVRKVKKPRS